MRGAQARTARRSLAAAAQGQNSAQAGKTHQAKESQAWSAEKSSLSGNEAVSPEELQEVLWKQFFVDTGHWWDNRRSKLSPRHPDFVHKESRIPLWLSDRLKPGWVDSRLLATVDDNLKPMAVSDEMQSPGAIEPAGTFGAIEPHVDIGVCWKLCEDGDIRDAVDALHLLVQRRCHVPSSLFYRVIKRCIRNKELALGRRIHALTVQSGFEGDAFLATHLICLYASHGRLQEAMGVFRKVPTPDAYNWATIISAYARHGEAAEAAEAIRLYRRMSESSAVEPDDRLYSALLKACAVAKDVVAGKEVHARLIGSSKKPQRFVQAGLVNMYAKCGCLEDARRLFDELWDRNVVTWTAMIAGYAQHGMGREALHLYSSMQKEGLTPNVITYVCLLQACASIGGGALCDGKQLHVQIEAQGLEEDAVVGGSLVNMYAKCGSLEDARRLFDKLADKNVVAWTAMIAGYSQQGRGQEALSLYTFMQQEGVTPNAVTFRCLLQACAAVGLGALHQGKLLHAQIEDIGLEEDAVLGGSLVNMYAKCGGLEDARRLFDKLLDRTVVAWTSMIAGYAQEGMGQEALTVYSSMRQKGFTPDSVTYVCLLQACATIGVGALHEGKQLHAQIKQQGLEQDRVLGGSLVNMYAKFGRLEDARRVFDKLPDRNVVVWNAMIAGYAQQGMGQEALRLYHSMQQGGLPPNTVTYVLLLQACASVGVGALHEGKQLHAQIRERRLEEDVVLGGSLVNMYAKCGRLGDARRLLDKLPKRSLGAWTAMIAGYAQQGMGQEALDLYIGMQQDGLTPDAVTYARLLQACASVGVGALHEGKQLHVQIEEQGLDEDVVLSGCLVNMYAKCGSFKDARKLLEKRSDQNVVAWNAMIAGYAQQGMGQEAISVYSSMQQEGLTADTVTYVCLLQACACAGVSALHEGRQLHAQIQGLGVNEDAVIGGSLVNMYTKCGSLDDARRLFDYLPDKNVAAWNAMIAGYAQHGMGEEAFRLYDNMQQEGLSPSTVTYVCLLQACASGGLGALPKGKKLHAQIEDRGLEVDPALGKSLVNMYVKCGSLEDARRLFDELPDRNVLTWNAMISGYAQQGMDEEALALYSILQQEGLIPDSVTYVCLLQACASSGVGALHKGKQLHSEMEHQGLEVDAVLGGSLVNMYAKCGNLDVARKLFDNLLDRNIVAWNAMISGYAQLGLGQEALGLYTIMQQEGMAPDSVTYVCLLQACATVGVDAFGTGKELHVQVGKRGLDDDVVLGGSLVNMYAKCGDLKYARALFEKLPDKNIVAWNAMIAGYAQQGMGNEALSLYSSMQRDGFTANSVTYVCLLQACAAAAALSQGVQLHAEIEGRGIPADGNVGGALVNMYAKCGSICDAKRVFESLFDRSLEAWNALLGGYARQGDSEVVFDLFARMSLEGVHPDGITFLCVLTVCSHVGLVDKGREYFEAMRTCYGVCATMEHYICMVDLLGRAGHLHEALQTAKNMPFPPNDVMWHTLLGACLKWKNVEIGQQAFRAAVRTDAKDAAAYVLMSNIYASTQMWEEAKEMRERRVKLGAWKKPGQSWWTDVGGEVHMFLVGDPTQGRAQLGLQETTRP